MKTIKCFLFVLIVFLFNACASKSYISNVEAYKGFSAQQIYINGKRELAKKNYNLAINHFEALNALYPFGNYSRKAQLETIHAYYEKHDMDSASIVAGRYIRLYPQDKDTDYAYYMRGLANFERNKSWLSKIYTEDPAARDLSSLKESYSDFNKLVTLYPHSQHVLDAKQRMLFIKDVLARHELQVANFYMKRNAYVAAANRAAYIVKNFPETYQEKSALILMIKAYQALGAKKQADDVLRIGVVWKKRQN